MDSELPPDRFRGPFVGPRATLLEDYLAELAALGYAASTIECHRRWLAPLEAWLAQRGDAWSELDERRLAEFAQEQWPGLGMPPSILARFLTVARARGHLRAPAVPAVRGSCATLLVAFGRCLLQERGYAASTVQAYQRVAHAFVTALACRGNRRPQRWRPRHVLAFVHRYLRVHGRANAHALTTALRCFLRFVQAHEGLRRDLAAAVPRVPVWSLARLPATLPADGIATVLAHCDRTTALGQRDYALLLLAARLGLRSSEICRLRLDDIDWVEGALSVRASKSGQAAILPLSAEVGRALAEYLQRARPPCQCREVFVRWRAPRVGLHRQAIYARTQAAFVRAGFTGVRQGAHTLRHTLASDLLRQGATLDEIAEILRHRDPSTTAIYAKVDATALRAVALPWPGGAR